MSQNKKAAVIFVQNLRLPSCFKMLTFFEMVASAFYGVHFITLVHLKVRSPSPCWRVALIEGQPFPTGPHTSHQEWQSTTHLLAADRGPGYV